MTDLAPAELAFRVGAFTGVLGVVGLFPGNLQWMAAFVLLMVALIYVYEIWVTRGSRRAQLSALTLAVLALASAVALIQGVAALVSTPLLAVAAVCIALGVAGTLGDSGDDPESETPH